MTTRAARPGRRTCFLTGRNHHHNGFGCGEGLCIGYDSGDAVSSEYKGKFPFSGGRIIKVIYDIADDVYLDQERKLAAALARD